MTYAGLEGATDEKTPHLGGSIRVGDPFTYCPSVWDYMISRFCIKSVLDVGSGSGNASDYFFRKGLPVVAVDGFRDSVMKSLYPAVLHDILSGPIITNVDLVHCQEVVEHIEEIAIGHLLQTLSCGKFCIMTHALPGQHGHHHVNLQPSEYWISKMESYGHLLLEEDTKRVRHLAEIDGAAYMKATGLVFVNKSRS